MWEISYTVPRQKNWWRNIFILIKKGKKFSNSKLFHSSVSLSWKCQENFSEDRITSLPCSLGSNTLSSFQHGLKFSSGKGIQTAMPLIIPNSSFSLHLCLLSCVLAFQQCFIWIIQKKIYFKYFYSLLKHYPKHF